MAKRIRFQYELGHFWNFFLGCSVPGREIATDLCGEGVEAIDPSFCFEPDGCAEGSVRVHARISVPILFFSSSKLVVCLLLHPSAARVPPEPGAPACSLGIAKKLFPGAQLPRAKFFFEGKRFNGLTDNFGAPSPSWPAVTSTFHPPPHLLQGVSFRFTFALNPLARMSDHPLCYVPVLRSFLQLRHPLNLLGDFKNSTSGPQKQNFQDFALAVFLAPWPLNSGAISCGFAWLCSFFRGFDHFRTVLSRLGRSSGLVTAALILCKNPLCGPPFPGTRLATASYYPLGLTHRLLFGLLARKGFFCQYVTLSMREFLPPIIRPTKISFWSGLLSAL